ncbi:MAG: alpha/beta hydrolase [Cyanobacteria bacterium P01_E01_bin.34]
MNRLLALQLSICAIGACYQTICSMLENRQPPPGRRIDIGGYRLHYCDRGQGSPTIVLDHSLGGVEGYLLFDRLSQLSRTAIYDRAGYGWSERSPQPRTSHQIVLELDQLLVKAGIEPPYLLVGDSFGSYNMRLYAHCFPGKVAGLVLTDGLHEAEMLAMPKRLRLLQAFFLSGFVMSAFGSAIGAIRLLNGMGLFELLKPKLRQVPQPAIRHTKHSFLRASHWVTMILELWTLNRSGIQLSAAKHLGTLPIVSIRADTFLHPSIWNGFLPIQSANELHDRIHPHLAQLSSHVEILSAPGSDHFVWVEGPDVLVAAVQRLLDILHSTSAKSEYR